MHNMFSSPLVINCSFINNSVEGGDEHGGGGIVNWGSSPTIVNCLFIGNSAKYGGGIDTVWSNSFALLDKCTFVNNVAGHTCGGAHFSEADAVVANCILWGNRDSSGISNSSQVGIEDKAEVAITYSCIEGWTSSLGGIGNIGADPCFDAPGDYHLRDGSPCIDAGDPGCVSRPGEKDVDGEPRVMNGRVDMGADEFTSAPVPIIVLSSAKFSFAAYEGGENPQEQLLGIYNGGSGTLLWEVFENCPWLNVYPNAGSSTNQVNNVTLGVDIASLRWGKYTCEALVSDPCASNREVTVYANLVVTGPILDLSATTVEFLTKRGSASLEGQRLIVTNRGGGTLNWTAHHDCSWLDVFPSRGSIRTDQSNEILLDVNISGLGRGKYECDLEISDPNAEVGSKTAQIVVWIAEEKVLAVPSVYPTI